jgi:hypothetical protein
LSSFEHPTRVSPPSAPIATPTTHRERMCGIVRDPVTHRTRVGNPCPAAVLPLATHHIVGQRLQFGPGAGLEFDPR